jgi:hypothetical protein
LWEKWAKSHATWIAKKMYPFSLVLFLIGFLVYLPFTVPYYIYSIFFKYVIARYIPLENGNIIETVNNPLQESGQTHET